MIPTRPWHNTPAQQPQGLKMTYQQVARWADEAIRAILAGDKEAARHASDMLHNTIAVAHQRMGLPDRFGTQPTTDSLLDRYSPGDITAMTTRQLYDLAKPGLHNDPLADTVITSELVRRGELSSEDIPIAPTDRLPLTGAPFTHTTTINPGEKPWKGSQRYSRAGANGYPATYAEILREYAAGGEACDNNRGLESCPHQQPDLPETEKTQFLTGVWKAGWRQRRTLIFNAQVTSGVGRRFLDRL